MSLFQTSVSEPALLCSRSVHSSSVLSLGRMTLAWMQGSSAIKGQNRKTSTDEKAFAVDNP